MSALATMAAASDVTMTQTNDVIGCVMALATHAGAHGLSGLLTPVAEIPAAVCAAALRAWSKLMTQLKLLRSTD